MSFCYLLIFRISEGSVDSMHMGDNSRKPVFQGLRTTQEELYLDLLRAKLKFSS